MPNRAFRSRISVAITVLVVGGFAGQNVAGAVAGAASAVDPRQPIAAPVLDPVGLGGEETGAARARAGGAVGAEDDHRPEEQPPSAAASPSAAGSNEASPSEITGAALAPAAVATALSPELTGGALGSGTSPAHVIDVATGQILFASHDVPTVPASTMKLVTAVSVLESLGADSHLTTRVVLTAPDAKAPRVVIVGGGDPSLTSTTGRVGGAGTSLMPASMEELAVATARGLAARGISRVRIGYDASLFTGPATHPTWARGFPAAGIVAPVSALQVDAGRRTPSGVERVGDPAAHAARVFADELAAAGVTVRGEPGERRASAGSPTIARVESPPVGVLVERMLTASDNDYAEALGRLGAAASGQPASFAGVSTHAEQVLSDLGIGAGGARFADASGLSRRNRLAPSTLTELLRVSAVEVGELPAGLPVAGATGSLAARFGGLDQTSGRGLVRAKTGTLTGVAALAGLASRPDGRLLAFVFLDGSAPGGAQGARAALDRAAAALVTCDCTAD